MLKVVSSSVKFASHALYFLPAEKAHETALRVLKMGLSHFAAQPIERDPRLIIDILGLHFSSPIGMAPGFDKNGEVFAQLSPFGFGFTEIGTITPHAQDGNPKPRIFRLKKDNAIINRYGLNNEGYESVYARLAQRRGTSQKPNSIVGVNIGANNTSHDVTSDYIKGLDRF